MPPDSRMRESQQDLVSLPARAPGSPASSAPAATTIRENKKILAQTLFIDTNVEQKVSLEHFRRLEKYSKQQHCCCLTAAIFRINIPECIKHFISLCFSFVSIKTHKGLSQVFICFKCFHSQRSGDECLVILGPINLPFSQFPPFTITAHHLAHFFLFCRFL